MRWKPALLEDWLRERYFTAEIDLASSGVPCWSFAELCEMVDIDRVALDAIRFDDSPSLGAPGLRTQIAKRWGNGDPARVIVCHGSSEAIFLATASLLRPGDEMVVVDPGYHALSATAEAVGCRVVPWRLDAGDGFRADLDLLGRLVTARTRMLVVNFPNNPTGATITVDEQRALVELSARHGLYLLWDNAFGELTYQTAPLPDPGAGYERCLTVGTLSKAYGLPGIRVGWCLGAPQLLAGFLPLRDRTALCLSPLIEHLAEQVVRRAERLLAPRLAQAAANRRALAEWAAAHPSLVEYTEPAGGVTAFPRLRPARGDVDEFCTRLSSQHSVLLVPGSCFGRPNRVRLGFGTTEAEFHRGLSRLRAALEQG